MEALFKILSAILFSIAVIGFVALGIYWLFFEESGVLVGVVGQAREALDQSTVFVDNLLSEQPGEANVSLKEMAYKQEETEWDIKTILLYILGALAGLYALKKLAQFWNYLVKNSV